MTKNKLPDHLYKVFKLLPLQRQYDQEHKHIHALLTADLQDWRKYRDEA
ncbi:TPA: hypothetical protein ACGO8I_000206 [Streptococcus suis]